MESYVKICIILFKNWKHIFKYTTKQLYIYTEPLNNPSKRSQLSPCLINLPSPKFKPLLSRETSNSHIFPLSKHPWQQPPSTPKPKPTHPQDPQFTSPPIPTSLSLLSSSKTHLPSHKASLSSTPIPTKL